MNLNTVLTEAIAKGAVSATRKPIAALRGDVADLKRQVAELKRLMRSLQKGARRSDVKAPAPEAETAKPARIRPTGPMVRKLRAKLGLTQAQFARLAGVSTLTAWKWETAAGRISLKSRTMAALLKVKAMGKRDAKKALAEGVAG